MMILLLPHKRGLLKRFLRKFNLSRDVWYVFFRYKSQMAFKIEIQARFLLLPQGLHVFYIFIIANAVLVHISAKQ